ncbi:MAG: hypothetical protein ACOYBY_16110 [Dermatophilaceae bacterium]
MSPRAGPRWTRARLERVMRLRFGTNRRGHVDTTAAAAALGVSQRTVQRWLHGAHGRSRAQLPPARLQQLIGLLQPSEDTRRREEHQARYAAEAIEKLRSGKGGARQVWQRQRWLEPHLVVVIQTSRHRDPKIRQITVNRVSSTKNPIARRGTVIDQAVVPTRFHATVLVHHVLTTLALWRIQVGVGDVEAGFTQAWLADAPATQLDRAAAQLGLT